MTDWIVAFHLATGERPPPRLARIACEGCVAKRSILLADGTIRPFELCRRHADIMQSLGLIASPEG